MQVSRPLVEFDVDVRGINLESPLAHDLNVMKAFIGDVDVTEDIRRMVVDSRHLTIHPNTNSYRDLLNLSLDVRMLDQIDRTEAGIQCVADSMDSGSQDPPCHTNSSTKLSLSSLHITVLYVFQTPCWSITCRGYEDIRIPSYREMLSTQALENATIVLSLIHI